MDPLFNEGWIAFNEMKWGVKSKILELGPEAGNAWYLKVVLYEDKEGRLVLPPRNPYLPLFFETSAEKKAAINRRKRAAMEKVATIVSSAKVKSSLTFSPVADDLRPFTWLDFLCSPLYTYRIDLSNFENEIDRASMQQMRKAEKNGYFFEVTSDFDLVNECLRAPEERKGFQHFVSSKELTELQTMMGKEAMNAVLVRTSNGEPVAASIFLVEKSGLVQDWSAGVKTSALKDGVNAFMVFNALKYYNSIGCKIFDFCGANIKPVAEMKEYWGGELVAYFSISSKSAANVLRSNISYVKKILRA